MLLRLQIGNLPDVVTVERICQQIFTENMQTVYLMA